MSNSTPGFQSQADLDREKTQAEIEKINSERLKADADRAKAIVETQQLAREARRSRFWYLPFLNVQWWAAFSAIFVTCAAGYFAYKGKFFDSENHRLEGERAFLQAEISNFSGKRDSLHKQIDSISNLLGKDAIELKLKKDSIGRLKGLMTAAQAQTAISVETMHRAAYRTDSLVRLDSSYLRDIKAMREERMRLEEQMQRLKLMRPDSSEWKEAWRRTQGYAGRMEDTAKYWHRKFDSLQASKPH